MTQVSGSTLPSLFLIRARLLLTRHCEGVMKVHLISIQNWDRISDTHQICDLLHVSSREINQTNNISCLIDINEI